MSVQVWMEQLRALGLEPKILVAPNVVAFPFTVPVGPLFGIETTVAVAVPDDTLTPPTGPHVSPQLLPLHPDQSVGHPVGGVHPAPHLGPDWQYWSRPFGNWLQSSRDAAAYLAHIRHLFATL